MTLCIYTGGRSLPKYLGQTLIDLCSSAAFTWCQRYTEFSGVWLHCSPHWPALSPCVILPRFGEHWRFDRSGVCWNLSESTQVSELPLVCTWSFHCFYNFSRLILKVHNGSQVADFLRVIELNRCFNCTAFNLIHVFMNERIKFYINPMN